MKHLNKPGWEYPRKVKQTKYLHDKTEELERLGLSKELLTKLYWDKGLSCLEIEKDFHVIGGINSLMKYWDIPRRKVSESFHLSKLKQLEQKGVTKEILEELYLRQKMSMRNIDKKFGFLVSYYFKYFNIPIRKNTDHNNYREYSPEIGRKISEKRKAYFSLPDNRKKVSDQIKKRISMGWKPSVENANKVTRALWADPVFKYERLKKLREYVSKTPNKCELELYHIICMACPGEYTHNWSSETQLRIDSDITFIPDFVHKSKKKVIEFFGDFWHGEFAQCSARAVEPGKVNYYHSIGYDCLVIWEHDLKNMSEEQLILIVKRFNNRELEPYLKPEYMLITNPYLPALS